MILFIYFSWYKITSKCRFGAVTISCKQDPCKTWGDVKKNKKTTFWFYTLCIFARETGAVLIYTLFVYMFLFESSVFCLFIFWYIFSVERISLLIDKSIICLRRLSSKTVKHMPVVSGFLHVI